MITLSPLYKRKCISKYLIIFVYTITNSLLKCKTTKANLIWGFLRNLGSTTIRNGYIVHLRITFVAFIWMLKAILTPVPYISQFTFSRGEILHDNASRWNFNSWFYIVSNVQHNRYPGKYHQGRLLY